MNLEEQGVVITGAGRGIGAAIARALAAAGARVLVSSRTESELEAVASSIRDAGGDAHIAVCDVTDPDSVATLGAKAYATFGTPSILINNAGSATAAPLAKITLEDWNRMLAVHATGTFLVTQQFLPAMVECGSGRVINIASTAARAGAPYIAAYCAAKHAVLGFTRAVAAEVACSGVTVNAVCPGYVDTPMTDNTVRSIRRRTGKSEEEVRASLAAMSPQNRLYRPEEVAHVVLSLCAEDAAGINGQAIVIDGGALQA